MNDPIISVKNIHKKYPGFTMSVHALKGVSLDVQRGQIFGLLGPNGAGKTTLLKLMLGLFPATSGMVNVFGSNVKWAQNRKKLGYLPENHKFPPYLTGQEVLEIYSGLSGVPFSQQRKLIPEIVSKVGLRHEFLKMKVKKYSKGMQQRLGLAQALIHKPEIVFLDEPTDGVDPIGRKEIRDLLSEMNRQGTTIFLNSHLLSEVEAICESVAIMNSGEFLWTGDVSEINSSQKIYSFEVNNLSEVAVQELISIFPNSNFFQKGFTIEVFQEEDVTHVIDILRKHEVTIYSVIRLRKSLESFFMECVQKQTATASQFSQVEVQNG